MRIPPPAPSRPARDPAKLAATLTHMQHLVNRNALRSVQRLIAGTNARIAAAERAATGRGVPAAKAARLQTQVSTGQQWVARAQRAVARESLAAPAAAADSWILRGFVIDAQGRPVAGLHVQLLVNGAPLVGGDDVPGAALGDYSITLTRAQVQPLAPPNTTLATTGVMVPGLTLGLRVLDAQGAVVLRPADLFSPENGTVDRFDLVVPSPSGA